MPFRDRFDCLWCGTAHVTRTPDDLEGWAQLCPTCLGKAGSNPFLRTRLRTALAERGRASGAPAPSGVPAASAATGVATAPAAPAATRPSTTARAPRPATPAFPDDWFFRTAADAPTGARQLAQLVRRRGAHSLVVLMDASNRSYSSSFGRAAAAQVKALDGVVAAEMNYESGPALDYGDLARRIVGFAPDAVILVDSPGEAAIVAQQLRRLDTHAVVALSPWGANVQFVQFGGRAVEGTIALQAVNLDSDLPRMHEFARRYRQRFGEDPTTPAVQSYEAVMLGATALARGGRTNLRDTLAMPARWPGLDGEFALDAYGDTSRELHLTEVRRARFEALQ